MRTNNQPKTVAYLTSQITPPGIRYGKKRVFAESAMATKGF